MRYFGWFNKRYQQLEQGIKPISEDWNSFRKTGELLPKSMVIAMEIELEKPGNKVSPFLTQPLLPEATSA